MKHDAHKMTGETAGEMLARCFEIEVAGERVAATAALKPLYDPTGHRIRQ